MPTIIPEENENKPLLRDVVSTIKRAKMNKKLYQEKVNNFDLENNSEFFRFGGRVDEEHEEEDDIWTSWTTKDELIDKHCGIADLDNYDNTDDEMMDFTSPKPDSVKVSNDENADKKNGQNADGKKNGENPKKKKRGERKYLSCKEFYRYQFQQRKDHHNVLVRSGKMMQQYACDMCCKMEQNALNIHNCKEGQKQLRAEKYQILSDALQSGNNAKEYGKRVVLPSSFTQGPRYKQQQFSDSMAICREMGKPDLFLTITANPKWPEIVESLHEDESYTDRPDIVNRVFKIKVRQLLDLIKKKKVFGQVDSVI